jgi:hypothetical protein
MTVEIRAYITKDIPGENRYRVNVSIIDAVNIEMDVLVFDEEHNTFSHVATVYDMESYPASRTAAHSAGLQFYRARGVTREFNTVQSAIYFETVTKSRLKLLAVDWEARTDNFSSNEYITVDSNTSV